MSEKLPNISKGLEKNNLIRRGLEYVWGTRFSPKEPTPEEKQLVLSLDGEDFTEETIEAAKAISNYKPQVEPKEVTFIEQMIGLRAVDKVASCLFKNLEGQDSREKTLAAVEQFEAFSIEELYYDAEPALYLNFPGWGLGDKPRNANSDNVLAALPKGGVTVNITSPGSITAVHPEQCIRSNERVFAQVMEVVEKYPNYKIRGFMQSAGTQYTWIMNRLAELYPDRVDKVVAISTGVSIGDGQFMTPVTEKFADICASQGFSKESYTAAIAKYTQQENLLHLAKLPPGTVMYISGTNDGFVPFHAEGGTATLLEIGKRYGLQVDSIEKEGLDHVTLMIYLMKELVLGHNVYKLAPLPQQTFDELPEHLRQALIDSKGSGTLEDPNKHIDDFAYSQAHEKGYNLYTLLSREHFLQKYRVHDSSGVPVAASGNVNSFKRAPHLTVSSRTFKQSDQSYLDWITDIILKHAQDKVAQAA